MSTENPTPADNVAKPSVEKPKAVKPPKAPNVILPWCLVGFLCLVIAGAGVWFFLFYTGREAESDNDKPKKSADSAKGDAREGADREISEDGTVTEKNDEQPLLQTPDLAYNDLKGPVQLATSYMDYGSGPYKGPETMYDASGKWINIPKWLGEEQKEFKGYSGPKFERDYEGNIIKVRDAYADEGEATPTVTSIVWENGRIVRTVEEGNLSGDDYYYSSSSDTKFEYDNNGNLKRKSTATRYSSSYDSGSFSTSETYSYTSFDKYGNWTRRNVVGSFSSNDGDTYENQYVETREIIYY